MKHLFIGNQTHLEQQWLEAFSNDAFFLNSIDSVNWKNYDFIWIMDDFPSVNDLLKSIRSNDVPVVVLSLTPSVQASIRFFQEGALGYCHAIAAPNMLQHVVNSVQAGDIWLGAELMQQMIKRLTVDSVKQSSLSSEALLSSLTEKEQKVARLVSEGLSNREVADQLFVSERTVKAHLTQVFDKLKIRDRVHLALLLKQK